MVNERKRKFRVDAGASVPMVGKNHLTPEDAGTMPASKTLCETLTAHGTVFTCGEATVHFEDLDMSVTLQLLEDSQPFSLRDDCAWKMDTHTSGNQVSLLFFLSQK